MRRNIIALGIVCGLTGIGCSGADVTTPDLGPGPVAPPSDESEIPTQEPQTPDPGPEVCPDATGVYGVEPAESNLLFLLDRSGSMHLRVQEEETRWTLTKAGLLDLLGAMPPSTNAGLSMFPAGDDPITCCDITVDNVITCGNCGPGELPGTELRCDPGSYLNLPVGMAPLGGGQLDAIASYVSTADDEFYWGTPLAPALDGAIDGALNLGMNGVTSVVLLTDGRPTSCHTDADPEANDIQRAIDAATSGLGTGLRTYVVGVIDGEAAAHPGNLSSLAVAGGTARYPGCEDADDCAYSVNVDSFEGDLNEALTSIALESMSCTYDLPNVDDGLANLSEVNITITSGDKTFTVPQDPNHVDGWDYLNGDNQVQLYGYACETLKGDVDATVEVVVGCETIGG